MIDRIVITTPAAAGGAGVATATGYSLQVSGEVLAVDIAYLGSPPSATTDVTLTDESDPRSESIITLVNVATDVKIYPRRITETNDGTDILYVTGEEVHAPYVVHGRLKLVIAGANDADYAVATVYLRR